MTKSLFKFFPYRAHDLDAIANNYLWFSHYSSFNDPLEDVFINNALEYKESEFNQKSAIKYMKELYKREMSPIQVEKKILSRVLDGTFEKIYQGQLTQAFSAAKKEFKKRVDGSKACCFARDTDEGDALSNQLMWSHYADGLRGFCIEFDTKQLMEGISKNIGEPIGYSVMEYGKLKKFSFEELSLNLVQNMNTGSEKFSIGDIVACKSNEWSYESEFRLINNNKDISGEVKIPIESILSITVGSKMLKTKLTTLISILRGIPKLKCSLYEAYIDENTFELKKRPLCEIG